VRFDDTLKTVLAMPTDDVGAKAAVWMQVVDILAQDKGTLDPALREQAHARAQDWRDSIPDAIRQSAARSLGYACRSADLVALFGSDRAAIAAPVLKGAHLTTVEWEWVIPALPTASRALLRERRDLPVEVRRMLASYGASDFALPGTDAESSGETISQIRELVAKIEAFRKDKHDGYGEPFEVQAGPSTSAFRFETGVDGLINWVEGAPRGPILGIELGAMAEVGEHGVDGHAAGAFRRRTPFRNARMRVPGDGPAAGDWLISGLPRFDSVTGRFEGYRCTARRPHRDEQPFPRATALVSPGLPPDSLRQLIHELRTPLNAIRGFAEMISAQLLGPVSAAYRTRAEAIIGDARKLLTMFDDLDVAAKLERGAFEGRSAAGVDAADVLRDVLVELRPQDSLHPHQLEVAVESELPSVSLDMVTVERLFSRLVATILSVARSDETLHGKLFKDGGNIVLEVDRPMGLRRLAAADILDPTHDPEGDWPDAPPLGLGFAMRLIHSMSAAVGARFDIEDGAFALRLPMAATNGAVERL